jgi:hypothetical protein
MYCLTYGTLAELFFLPSVTVADCQQRQAMKLSKRMESGLASASGSA